MCDHTFDKRDPNRMLQRNEKKNDFSPKIEDRYQLWSGIVRKWLQQEETNKTSRRNESPPAQPGEDHYD